MDHEPHVSPTAARRIKDLETEVTGLKEAAAKLVKTAKVFRGLLAIAVTKGGGYLAVTPAEIELADADGYEMKMARSPVGGMEVMSRIRPAAVPALVGVDGTPLSSGRGGGL